MAVSHGEAIRSSVIAERMVPYFGQVRAHLSSQAVPELTDREYEILGLLAQRRSNAEIARRLVLTPIARRRGSSAPQLVHVASVLNNLEG